MPDCQSNYGARITVDILLLLAVSFPILLLFLLAEPFQRGFYCTDENIRYPYKKNTISASVLFVVGFFLPIIGMCLVEFLRNRKDDAGKQVQLFGRRMSSWFWAIYAKVGVFLFGCACSQLFTDIAKYSLGYLRPNFIEVCNLNWTMTTCDTDRLAYVEPIPCNQPDAKKLQDARLSFPSGHASFSAFTMIYLVIYLQTRLKISGFRLLRPVLQIICLLITFYTCLSRISDYQHHWRDVVGGFILGGTIAVLVAFFVSDLFDDKSCNVRKDQVVVLQDYHHTPNVLQDYHHTSNDESHTNPHLSP